MLGEKKTNFVSTSINNVLYTRDGDKDDSNTKDGDKDDSNTKDGAKGGSNEFFTVASNTEKRKEYLIQKNRVSNIL